jgi:hypothetical protein
MQTHLRQLAVAAALTFGASAVAAMPAMAQQDENHQYQRRSGTEAQRTDPDTYANHPDYSNSEYYRTGNDEGYQDYHAKKQREKHEHQYRNDDDRKAHDYGYHEGWSGRSYKDNQNYRANQTYGDNQQYRDNQTYRNNDNKNRNDQNSQYRDRDQKHDKDDDHDAH